jgi:hypothetical protein
MLKVKGMVRQLVNEPWLKCPHCLNAEEAEFKLPIYNDGDTDELVCSWCNRLYEIRVHVHQTFDCYPKGAKP